MTEKTGTKIYGFVAMIFFENILLTSISRSSIQTSSSDYMFEGNFTWSNSIILVEDLIRWKKSFEVFLIDHYTCDVINKNAAVM